MIELKNLSKIFKNQKGIKDINFKINNNEIIAILGPNGSGKSTLIKSIFKEYKIKNEEVKIEDNLKMSYFTDQSLFPKDLTLNFFCQYSAELCGVNSKEAKLRTEHLLKSLELYEYKNSKLGSLSAGMQKRAMLAVSLINDPDIIFLDEPTANLDIESRKALINLLKDMAKNNKSIVITSHIIDELQNLVNRVLILNEGNLVYDKKYDSKKENLEEIYFNHTKAINTDNDNDKPTKGIQYDNLVSWGKK